MRARLPALPRADHPGGRLSAKSVRNTLERNHGKIHSLPSVQRALPRLVTRGLPDTDGLDVLRALRAEPLALPVVVMTGGEVSKASGG